MWWYMGMLSLPIGFCLAYFMHGIRCRRYGQSAAIGVLIGINFAAIAVLLYEFLRLP